MRLKGLIQGVAEGCVAAFVQRKNIFLLAVAIGIGALMIVAGVGLLPDIYYRPHEKYDAGGRYQPNVNITFPSPMGRVFVIVMSTERATPF